MSRYKGDKIDRLKSLCISLGLNSRDFAIKAGIDPSNYSSIENRKRILGERYENGGKEK